MTAEMSAKADDEGQMDMLRQHIPCWAQHQAGFSLHNTSKMHTLLEAAACMERCLRRWERVSATLSLAADVTSADWQGPLAVVFSPAIVS